GLIPDELPDGDFAFLYTIPTFQNPSGRTLSLERRLRIAELARERQLLVLEDDPYGLVRYDGEPLPSVFDLADGDQIAYCSSFSKTVAPGLRVGWFVLPPRLATEIEALAVSTYISPPYATQATVLELLRRDSFEPNLERVNGRRRRSSCAARIPPSRPIPTASRISQTSETRAVAKTKWTLTCFRFSSTNAIAYARSIPRRISRT